MASPDDHLDPVNHVGPIRPLKPAWPSKSLKDVFDPDPEPTPRPDWDRWEKEQFVPLRVAVLLSMDVDPLCSGLKTTDDFRSNRRYPEFDLREARQRFGISHARRFELVPEDAYWQQVSLTSFAALAISQGWSLPSRFPRPPADVTAEVAPSGLDQRDLRAKLAAAGFGFLSPRLLATLDAAFRFWRFYDPEDPGTAPDTEDVKQHGIPGTVGDTLASVLRDPNLPKGRPRKDETP